MRIFPWICFEVVSLLYYCHCLEVLLCGFVTNLNFVIFYSELEKSKANELNGQKANLEDGESDSDEVYFTFFTYK